MASDLESLSKERMDEGAIKITAKFLLAMASALDEEEDFDEFKEIVCGQLDNLIYNATKIKEALETK